MNLHFISFLIDVVSWLIAGYMYGKYISKFDGRRNATSNIESIKISMFALLGGLIATFGIALPEYGFALHHFLIAMIFAFVYSLNYFNVFRKRMADHINYILKISKYTYFLLRSHQKVRIPRI